MLCRHFLLVVVLNWVMQVFGKEIATFPLVFVLACSSVKDIFEDWRRRRFACSATATPGLAVT